MKQVFEYDAAINAVLYALNELGGRTDMHKLCKVLYFADQTHLSRYGRSITGDTYIAMKYGPVPSKVDDILKAVRGDSFFSGCIDLSDTLTFDNRFIVRALRHADMDYLSETDVLALNEAVTKCHDKSFDQLVALSHGLAWNNTAADRAISVKDIMREAGDEEDYINFVADQIRLKAAAI